MMVLLTMNHYNLIHKDVKLFCVCTTMNEYCMSIRFLLRRLSVLQTQYQNHTGIVQLTKKLPLTLVFYLSLNFNTHIFNFIISL